nr:crossover junction endonuclease MUS81-like [Aedes albopictus]
MNNCLKSGKSHKCKTRRRTRAVRIVRRQPVELARSTDPFTESQPIGSHSVRQICIKYLTCPNPLYERWLLEMIAEAQEKDAKSRLVLQKALTSLRRYPLPIRTPRDCIMLTGFGMGICEKLVAKLNKFKRDGGVQFDEAASDAMVEKMLNDQQGELYRKLVPEVEAALDEEDNENLAPTEEQFEIPDDSVFDHLEVVENEHPSVSNPKAILLVDTQETIGKSKTNLDRTLKELEQYHIDFEVRRLSAGDFLWIVRDDTGTEYILPYIVERKRMDDLASSIKDGRFHEQKFRLKQCRLANVVYLIENLGQNRQVGVLQDTLTQAALNTYVQDFTVKYTDDHRHTVLYLSIMTELLNKNLDGKTFWNITNLPVEATTATVSEFNLNQRTVPLISFVSFNKESSKTADCSVREVFIKQLLQIKLLAIDKANAIVDKYPTPKELILAYERCTSEEEREKLLNISYGPMRRTIGLKLSKTVYQLFMSDVYQ